MKMPFILTLCAAMIGALALSSPVAAQLKTAKACQEEWRANRAANQAAGITQKAYVEKCRTGSATAQPAATPAAAPARPAATTSDAPQKTVRACQEEWRANRAANQAAGITQKAYVEKCRTGSATAQPAATPAAAPARPAATTSDATQKTVRACQEEWRANRAANQAAGITQKAYVEKCRAGTTAEQPAPTTSPRPAPASPAATTTAPVAPTAAPRAPAAGTPTGAGQFATEAQAKARCPRDTVVWVNLDSKIYHFAGYKDYGNTKTGAYMCERDTAAGDFRAAKNEKHP
jgi:hypothetical protein